MTFAPGSRHRPRHHLTVESGWLNDPNGPIYVDGRYHLFAQHNPVAPVHSNVHWAHWTSADLVTWTPHPVALTPRPGAADSDGCWSGSAIDVDGQVVLVYSGYRADDQFQSVCIAWPTADGTWVADAEPVLAAPPPGSGAAMMRDPFLWRAGDEIRMIVGSGDRDGRPNALVYASTNLYDWRYLGMLVDPDDPVIVAADSGAGWECPQLLVRDERAVLLVSAWRPPGVLDGVHWFAGRWDGSRLVPDSSGLVDYGPDFYAADLLDQLGLRPLVWAWSWEARDQTAVDEAGWAGLLTFPRTVTLDESGSPMFSPAHELETLRQDAVAFDRELPPGSVRVLDPQVGSSLDIEARLVAGTAGVVWLRVLADPAGLQWTEVGLDASLRVVYVDREHASSGVGARGGRYQAPVVLDAEGGVDVRVLVDVSVVEVFVAGLGFTVRVYPDGDDAVGLIAGAEGSAGRLRLTCWKTTAD